MPLHNVTGITKDNFQDALKHITVSSGTFAGGRKVRFSIDSSLKIVSFNEVYKALKEVADSPNLTPENKTALSKAIVKLRQKDIASDKKWFLGKNIAKLAGKLINPFNKQEAIKAIEEKTDFSPKLLEASAKFIAKYPDFEELTNKFLEKFIKGEYEESGLGATLSKGLLSIKMYFKFPSDWVTLCNEAIDSKNSNDQQKIIASAAREIASMLVTDSEAFLDEHGSPQLKEAIIFLDNGFMNVELFPADHDDDKKI